MELTAFLGRLHPLILHLPIGFLMLGFIMEWATRNSLFKTLEPAVIFALFWGMISAIFAALFGYWLSLEGGYDEVLLSQHQNLGILTAVLSVVVFGLKSYQSGKIQSGVPDYVCHFDGCDDGRRAFGRQPDAWRRFFVSKRSNSRWRYGWSGFKQFGFAVGV